MGWRDLPALPSKVSYPWIGQAVITTPFGVFRVKKRPPEYGWWWFDLVDRVVLAAESAVPVAEALHQRVRGYLVGDRLVPDGQWVDPDPAKIAAQTERVYLLDDGLDRFVRVEAGRIAEGEPLVFIQQDFPIGPENLVLTAFLDRAESVGQIRGVTPALDAAFRMESWRRNDGERLRALAEQQRRFEELRRERERLLGQGGTAVGRRRMASVDFQQAAAAALRVSGAELLDHRPGGRGEMIVRFRFAAQRFECVVNPESFQILDAGVCLTRHDGVKGDTWLTLESLPGVIREAIDTDRLVIFRHV